MNNIFKIVGRLTKVTWNQDDYSNILIFLEEIKLNPIKQQLFFDSCKSLKIAPWIYLRMKEENLLHYLTSEIELLFNQEYHIVLRQNEERNNEAVLVLEAFIKNDIDVIILKGNVFTQTIYKSFGYKRMNDFDILIKKEDWPKIQDIYHNLGFIPLGFGWTGEKHKATKFSHTGIPYVSRNLKCMIGSQWGLKSPTSSYKFNLTHIWKTAEEYQFKGLKVKKLSSRNNLLHLILHLGVYKCGIRDCMDIYNLLLTEKIEEKHLKQFFIDTNGLDKAFFALNMCHKMANVPNLEFLETVDYQKKSFLKNKFEKRIKAIFESENWHVSYNDYFQDIEKNVVYFNIFHSFHIKLMIYIKIIQQLFFPKSDMALKFIEKAHQPTLTNKIKAFFMAPFYIFSLLAEEIGLKITLIMIIKLFFNLLFSISNYFKPKETYFDYLKSEGIDPESVKNLVSNVQ